MALPFWLAQQEEEKAQVSLDNHQAVCKVIVKSAGLYCSKRGRTQAGGRKRLIMVGENQTTGKQHGTTIHLLFHDGGTGTRALNRRKNKRKIKSESSTSSSVPPDTDFAFLQDNYYSHTHISRQYRHCRARELPQIGSSLVRPVASSSPFFI